MLTYEKMIKYTLVTAHEYSKIGILVKKPEPVSKIRDPNVGYTYEIDVIGEHEGVTFASQVVMTSLDIRNTTDDEFMNMLNQAVRRVFEFRQEAIKQCGEKPALTLAAKAPNDAG